jgi:hypothetical protein
MQARVTQFEQQMAPPLSKHESSATMDPSQARGFSRCPRTTNPLSLPKHSDIVEKLPSRLVEKKLQFLVSKALMQARVTQVEQQIAPPLSKHESSATMDLSQARGFSRCPRTTNPLSLPKHSAKAAFFDWVCRSKSCQPIAAAEITLSSTGPILPTFGSAPSSCP